MKPVKVKYIGNLATEHYYQQAVKFAFCSKIEKGRTVSQLTSFVTCREDVIKYFRGRATNRSFKHVDIKRLRILTCFRTSPDYNKRHLDRARRVVDKKMGAAIKLLNHFETRAGWGLSKLYHTDNTGKFLTPNARYGYLESRITNKEPYIHVYMVVSSNKWLKSSHYVSLYLLMLRIGSIGFKGTFRSHKQLMETELPTLLAKSPTDSGYIRSSYKKWDIFLKNQRDLLKGRTSLKDSFKLSHLSLGHNSGYNEGIEKLVSGKSFDMQLADRWYALCKKHKIHQKKNVERARK